MWNLQAMELLNRQAGVVAFEPLKPIFLSVYSGAQVVVSGTPGAPFIDSAMHRNNENYSWSARGTDGLPAVAVSVSSLTDRIKSGYKAFTEGKLAESGAIFTATLQSVCMACVDSKSELDELRDQMSVCREYITAVLLESTRREQFKEDPTRNMELAAYLTHCNLQPLHLLISLRSAMSSAVKVKNFNTAASFCRRCVSGGAGCELASLFSLFERCVLADGIRELYDGDEDVTEVPAETVGGH